MTIPLSINSFSDIVSTGNIKVSWASYSIPPQNILQTYKVFYRLESPTLSSTFSIDGKTIGYEYFITNTVGNNLTLPLSTFGATIANQITSNNVGVSLLVKGFIQGLANPKISSSVIIGNFNAIKGDSTGGGIQARSTRVQVIDNVLYDEGEVMWYLNPVIGTGITPSVTKNEYSLWGRVDVDVSSRGDPSQSDYELLGTALIGVGSTDGPNTLGSNAIRVSLSTGKPLNAFSISKFGSNYDPKKFQLTLRGPVTDTKTSNTIYLGSNNTTLAQRDPIVTKVTLPSTFSNVILTDYDGHIQKHAPDAPSVFLYGCAGYVKPSTTVPYVIFNISRTNLIGLNLDNNSLTKVLMRTGDTLPNSTSTVLQRGIYSTFPGPDGSLFITQNKITNNSSESPSFITEISKRWDSPNFPYATLPKTTPSNSYRQLGGCSDCRWSSSLGGYYVWTCAESANILSRGISRVKWNGTNFEGSQILLRGGNAVPFDVRTIVSDGNNNIWATGKFNYIIKIYNTEGDPNSRYEQSFDKFSQSPYGINQKYIEYFLTRDHLLMSSTLRQQWLSLIESNYSVERLSVTDNLGKTPTFNRFRYGIKVKGTTVEQQVSNIKNFVETNKNLIGREIYSKFNTSIFFVNNVGNLKFISFDKAKTTNILGEQRVLDGINALNSDSGEMGSDWSGTSKSFYSRSIELLGEGRLSTGNETGGSTLGPTMTAEVFLSYSDSPLNESFFSNASTGFNSITAYDNFIFGVRANTTLNDYRLSEYRFFTDDFDYDIGSPTMNVTLTSILSSFGLDSYTHTYHDPNTSGMILDLSSRRSIGESYKTINTNLSGIFKLWEAPYTLSTISSPVTSITILERWPTAKFEVNGFDLSSTRQNWWGYGFINRNNFERPVSSEYVEGEFFYQSTSGTDPLSCDLLDFSIARTWPISGWWYTSGDGLSGAVFMNTSPTTMGSDYQLTGTNFWGFVYTKPGIYYPTLYVRASNTGTFSNILTTFNSENSASYIALSQRVHVLEYEPFAGFHVISGLTHLSSYSDNLSGYDTPVSNAYTNGNFISGYAPNLTVVFRSSSEPHSYPIERWIWNFGDYYSELTNTKTVTSNESNISTPYPQWTNQIEGHYAQHTYVMPGYYDVTLCVEASSSGTTDCKVLTSVVYVEEIPPTACYTISSNTGSIPLEISSGQTVVFLPSCTKAGSFPICRIDYDFGDGTPIYSIFRVLSSQVESISSTDPRNIPVSHTYVNTANSNLTINPSITAYACNTDTSSIFTSPLSSLITVYPKLSTSVEAEDRRLIGSRLDNGELLLTFEGVESGFIYNLALSSISTPYLSAL